MDAKNMWRPASPNEFPDIYKMCDALYVEVPSSKPVPESQIRRTLEMMVLEPNRGRPVILDVDGAVAGYGLTISYWSNELGGEICFIDEFYVLPRFRSNGFGRQLVNMLKNDRTFWARPFVAIALEVSPVNKRAQALYAEIGFKPISNTMLRLDI